MLKCEKLEKKREEKRASSGCKTTQTCCLLLLFFMSDNELLLVWVCADYMGSKNTQHPIANWRHSMEDCNSIYVYV